MTTEAEMLKAGGARSLTSPTSAQVEPASVETSIFVR